MPEILPTVLFWSLPACVSGKQQRASPALTLYQTTCAQSVHPGSKAWFSRKTSQGKTHTVGASINMSLESGQPPGLFPTFCRLPPQATFPGADVQPIDKSQAQSETQSSSQQQLRLSLVQRTNTRNREMWYIDKCVVCITIVHHTAVLLWQGASACPSSVAQRLTQTNISGRSGGGGGIQTDHTREIIRRRNTANTEYRHTKHTGYLLELLDAEWCPKRNCHTASDTCLGDTGRARKSITDAIIGTLHQLP